MQTNHHIWHINGLAQDYVNTTANTLYLHTNLHVAIVMALSDQMVVSEIDPELYIRDFAPDGSNPSAMQFCAKPLICFKHHI